MNSIGLDPNADNDGDGLTNLQAWRLGTNPYLRDSDGDGIPDGEEVRNGTDPRRHNAAADILRSAVPTLAVFPTRWTTNDPFTFMLRAVIPGGLGTIERFAIAVDGQDVTSAFLAGSAIESDATSALLTFPIPAGLPPRHPSAGQRRAAHPRRHRLGRRELPGSVRRARGFPVRTLLLEAARIFPGCKNRNDSVPCGTMTFHANPVSRRLLDDVLGRTPHVRVLRFLRQVPGAHSGRAIARTTGVSHPAVHRVMRTLVGRGLAAAARHGKALAYSLNGEHWLVRHGFIPLFATEEGWLREVGAEVKSVVGVPVKSIVLFGSAARGDVGPRSDLDLVCLLKDARQISAAERALAEQGDRLRRRFGRHLSVMVMAAEAFRRRYRHRERLVREIVETGWVIDGDPLAEVLR